MDQVFIVFRINEFEERALWKVFSTKEKAEKWIEKYGTWTKFVIDDYEIN